MKRWKKKKKRKVFGTLERPRLSVYKAESNIHAQVIDDVKGVTLFSVSSAESKLKKKFKNGGNIEAAKVVGEEVAARAKTKKVTKVVFDRGGSHYHGRIKALADSARSGGLQF